MSQELPYLPPGKDVLYVSEDSPFLQEAKKIAEKDSLDALHPTGAIIVRDGAILGKGANGSDYHAEHGCIRKKRGIPTGEGYELCPGCDPSCHAEQKALKNCPTSCVGADLYLWGHWWCCKSCWEAMNKAGIRHVYLLRGAHGRFAKSFKSGKGLAT